MIFKNIIATIIGCYFLIGLLFTHALHASSIEHSQVYLRVPIMQMDKNRILELIKREGFKEARRLSGEEAKKYLEEVSNKGYEIIYVTSGMDSKIGKAEDLLLKVETRDPVWGTMEWKVCYRVYTVYELNGHKVIVSNSEELAEILSLEICKYLELMDDVFGVIKRNPYPGGKPGGMEHHHWSDDRKNKGRKLKI